MTSIASTTRQWVGRPTPRDQARLRLFCLPHAGGGMAAYRPWNDLLSDEIELCLIQLPGREMRIREDPYIDLDELTSDLCTALAPLLDRPFAFFGHSMGALIGFALTRELRTQSLPQPVHLFVSGRRPPHVFDDDAPLHQLSDAAFVDALVRRYDGIPKLFLENPELLQLFLPTLRADLTMLETYSYNEQPPLTCPITAFGGWEDGRVTQATLAAWRDLTRGAFDLRMFPGGHFFIQSEHHHVVAAINEQLGEYLTRPNDRPYQSASADALRFGTTLPSASLDDMF